MTVTIERGRQFPGGGGRPDSLWRSDGALGPWLTRAAEVLVKRKVSLDIQISSRKLSLTSDAEWAAFLRDELDTVAKREGFPARSGISVRGFIELVDDLAAASDANFRVDLTPGSSVLASLSMTGKAAYATGEPNGTVVAPSTAVGAAIVSTAFGVEIVTAAERADADRHIRVRERDHDEHECCADVAVDSLGVPKHDEFAATGVSIPFRPLLNWDLDDPDTWAIASQLHFAHQTESSHSNEALPQDVEHWVRDTYFDDEAKTLEWHGFAVRVRVRYEKKDRKENPGGQIAEVPLVEQIRIQMKSGREFTDYGSVAHEVDQFESFNGTDEQAAHRALRSGWSENKLTGQREPLFVVATLFKRLGLGPEDTLRLEPRFMILQQRRRSHLRIWGPNTPTPTPALTAMN